MAFSSTAMAQAKSSTTTPQTDVNNAQPNAISYGSTRSNTKNTGIAENGTTRANINTSRSNRKTNAPIAAPIGCVTEAGAKDANCDGVDDAAQSR